MVCRVGPTDLWNSRHKTGTYILGINFLVYQTHLSVEFLSTTYTYMLGTMSWLAEYQTHLSVQFQTLATQQFILSAL